MNAPQAATVTRKARAAGDPPAAPTDPATEEAKAPAPKPPVLKPFLPADVRLVESVNVDRAAVACVGAKPEDYLDPAMWSMVSEVYSFDWARVVAADGSWWALYLLVSVDRKVASVRLLMSADIGFPDVPINDGIPEGYAIRRGMPVDGQQWVAYRKKDDLVLNPGMNHSTYEQTRQWLLGHAIFRDNTKPPEYY